MSFKDNLLRKIRLKQMKKRVLETTGPMGSGRKTDRKAMGELLEAGGFKHKKIRSLDLYLPEHVKVEDAAGKIDILVLDNDLTIYHTTIEDVALRKDPTLKEMISIRNAIKILSDSDVVVTKKEASVETVYNKALSKLDLSFTASDIKALEYDGRASVEWKDQAAVLECLNLFEELLEYSPPPTALHIRDCHIRGARTRPPKGEEVFGPAVIYNLADDSIKYLNEQLPLGSEITISYFHDIASGRRQATAQGPDVMKYLAQAVRFKK